MRHTFRRGLVAAFMVLFACGGFAETNISVTALRGNGLLCWTAGVDVVSATVEWAPSVTGPWIDTWERLVNMPNTGSTHSVAVPMFYRVVGTQLPKATFLLHADGFDGGTSFTDVCGHAVTATGEAHTSTNASVFGGASAQFDGNGDYLLSPLAEDLAFSTNDFTIDFRVRLTSLSYEQFIGQHQYGVSADWIVYMDHSSKLSFQVTGSYTITSSWTPSLNTWYHIAITRKSGYCRIFVDGQIVGENTLTQDLGSNHPLAIGGTDDGQMPVEGYIDEVRIIKGTAAWNAPFTPPAFAYLR